MPSITREEKVLLSLLAYEMFQRELHMDASNVDWTSVLDQANQHLVAAFLYPGMKRLEGVSQEGLERARGAAIFSAGASENMLASQEAVVDLLQERGIPFAVLKGASVAYLYPHPELRVPGDIDILVDAGDQEAVGDILEENDYVLVDTGDMHICYQKHSLWLEMHSMVSVFPDNERGDFTKKYMLDALCHFQMVRYRGISFPVLTGTYQLIALLTHMERHFRESGIGLRQLCDWAVTVDAQRSQIGEEELAVLEGCGLLHFAKISTRVCEKYLGLAPCVWSADVADALVDSLMRDILDGGSFQSLSQVRPFGSLLTNTYNVENTTLRSYSRYIRDRIREDYPWAKSGLWTVVFGVFYPFRWFVRMLMGKRKKVNLSEAVSSVQTRDKLLRELKLYT